MPKVSKAKTSAAGGKKNGLLVNRRAKQEDKEEEADDAPAGDVDTADQFMDAEAEEIATPSLPSVDDAPAAETESGDDNDQDVTAVAGADAEEPAGKSDSPEPGKSDSPEPGKSDSPEETTEDTAEGEGASSPPASLANDFRGGQESWNAMLYQLLLYKAIRGDLNIPHNDTSYRLLYNWVLTQRKHYKLYQDNKTSSTFLNADRIAVLDAIDFQWNVRGESFWQKHFEALTVYKTEHGDARVPRLYIKNPKLGEWVTDQRRQWKAKMEGKPNQMSEERKDKLDEMGFVWKVRDRADWNDRYEQLLEFKKENGHCIVPQHYVRNRSLGKWVAKQREQYRFYREGKHSFLTEERIDLLKSVEFVWQIKGKKKKKLAESTSAMDIDEELKERSLAKEEEEENEKNDDAMLKAPPLLHGALGGALGLDKASVKTSVDQQMPSLPAMSHQSLLPANMAAIAAHASSNQNMVADLAAALRFGGVNPNTVPLGDPRAVAALRAAQLGTDSKLPRSFSSMI